MNPLESKGDWNIIKAKLKQRWAKLTDNDLRYTAGKSEKLIGRIQKRTDETREAVEKAFKESDATGDGNPSAVAEAGNISSRPVTWAAGGIGNNSTLACMAR